MIDDLTYGTRNARGDWTPDRRAAPAPLFVWPPRPRALAGWLFGYPGYILGWNLVYAGLATAAWFLATPSRQTMRHLSPGWIALVLVRNAVLILVWYGAFHLRLYVRRSQGTRFKYNGRWPSPTSRLFTFGNQTADNMFWTLASGLPIWTAYEVVTLWMFANGHIPWMRAADNPVGFTALMLLIPMIRELHFYWVHRLIHWPAIYKRVHSLHHRNTNPIPWSGLSMHPIEHLLYFSGVLVHWLIPSHPLHAMFHLFHAGLAPVPGHTGFEKIELTDSLTVDTGCWAHYLHHKHFEVNYADGMIPLDKWFGSFHDGSPEADLALQGRRQMARASRAAVDQ